MVCFSCPISDISEGTWEVLCWVHYIEVSLMKAAFNSKHFLSVNVVNIMENNDNSKDLG